MDLGSGRRLYVARSKSSGNVVLVWLVPISQLEEGGELSTPCRAVTVDELNGLLYARSAEDLLDAIGSLRPLTWGDGDDASLGGAWAPGDRAASMLDKELCGASAASLVKEVVLPPYAQKGVIGLPCHVREVPGAKRAVARYGLDDDLLELLRSDEASSFAVRLETLRSWVFVRNLAYMACAAICAYSLVAGLTEDEAEKAIEERTSLSIVPEGVLSTKRLLGMPVAVEAGSPDRPFRAPFPDADPRYDRLLLEGPGRLSLVRSEDGSDWDGEKVVFAATAVGPDRTALEALSGVVREIGRLFTTGPKGTWSYGLPVNDVEGDDKRALGFWSVPAALWETVCHHRAHRLVMCERCSRVVLIANSGRKARWCSPSCKAKGCLARRAQVGADPAARRDAAGVFRAPISVLAVETGEVFSSIASAARALGVSTTTVRKAISEGKRVKGRRLARGDSQSVKRDGR